MTDLSKSPGAHRRDVRCDRRPLRPPQPSAERRHRSPLAAARDRGRCALTGRERVLDLCTGTADLAIAARTARPGGGARRRRRLRRRDAARRRGEARGAAARPRRSRWSAATRRGFRSPTGRVDAVTDRVRHPQRRAHGGGVRRDATRARRRAAGSRFSSSRIPDDARRPRRSICWYFKHVLPRIGRAGLAARRGVRLPAGVGRRVCVARRVREDSATERVCATSRPAR